MHYAHCTGRISHITPKQAHRVALLFNLPVASPTITLLEQHFWIDEYIPNRLTTLPIYNNQKVAILPANLAGSYHRQTSLETMETSHPDGKQRKRPRSLCSKSLR